MTQPPNHPGGWRQQGGQPGPQQWAPHGGHPLPGSAVPPQGFGGSFRSQYGGFDAFPPPEPPRRRGSKKPFLVGAVVLVLAAGAVTAWSLGAFRGDVLDPTSVEQGVVRVLRDSYGEHDVSAARCPANQEVTTGHTFECSVEVAGQTRTVTIRVLNDKPEFEVGTPR